MLLARSTPHNLYPNMCLHTARYTNLRRLTIAEWRCWTSAGSVARFRHTCSANTAEPDDNDREWQSDNRQADRGEQLRHRRRRRRTPTLYATRSSKARYGRHKMVGKKLSHCPVINILEVFPERRSRKSDGKRGVMKAFRTTSVTAVPCLFSRSQRRTFIGSIVEPRGIKR